VGFGYVGCAQQLSVGDGLQVGCRMACGEARCGGEVYGGSHRRKVMVGFNWTGRVSRTKELTNCHG